MANVSPATSSVTLRERMIEDMTVRRLSRALAQLTARRGALCELAGPPT